MPAAIRCGIGVDVFNHFGLCAILLAITLLCAACGNTARATTMHLMKTEGTVDVLDDKGADLEPMENMNLYSGYNMETLSESYAWINLDSVKLTKMDTDSEIEIQKTGKKLEIFVKSGSLYFNITEPLADDETLNIRTSTITAGIRGTCGWVKVLDESHMYLYLLEGMVECSVTDKDGEVKTATVSGGEMAEITDGEIRISTFKEPVIPDFVLAELLEDEALCRKIYEDSQLDVLGVFAETNQDGLSGDEESSGRQSSAGDETMAEEGSASGEGGLDNASSEDESHTDALEGIWVPDKKEWSGDYNDTIATVPLADKYKDSSGSLNGIMTSEEYNSLPDLFRYLDVGIWAYKENVKALSESDYGRVTSYNMDGYEWRVLTWGGPVDRMEDEIPQGYLLAESFVWRVNAENSKNWEESGELSGGVIKDTQSYILEYGHELKFTVTLDGVDYTDCRLVSLGGTQLTDGEQFFDIVLVRVPEEYNGAIMYSIFGTKEENGEIVENTDEYVTLLF